MADVLRDLSKWLNLANLQPENMTPLLVALAQGTFVAEDVIPRIPSTDEFLWLTEDTNDKFSLARKRGERGESSNNEVFDSRLSGETYEYFESSDITSKTLRRGNIYSFVNLVVRKTSMIAGKIRMNIERDLLTALQDTTTYTTINTRSGSALWTTTSTSDPIKDVALAKNDIVLAERISEPDTIILGSTDKTYMEISDNIRDTIQYTRDYTQTGLLMERLMGLRLLTSTAVYISGSTDVRLLSGTGIILKKGYAGELRESEPYLAYTDYNKRNKVLTIFGSRVIKPIVTRPKSICLLTNVS